MGKALLGKKKGEKVTIPRPAAAPSVPDRWTSRRVTTQAEPHAPPEGGLAALVGERRAKAGGSPRGRHRSLPAPSSRGRVEIAAVRAANDGLEAGEEGEPVRVAGRLAARRGQGRVAFLDLDDRSGRIQVWASADRAGDEARRCSTSTSATSSGSRARARTRRGELSVAAETARCSPKALRPPPDKFPGLADTETRYRQRYLDLIANAEARGRVHHALEAIAAMRRLLDDRGFVEVETPALQPIYGGAAARPFVTHHNALDRDLYLRIATELYLKRLIVGGIERVFELGKVPQRGRLLKHNPEFTMVELYEAYADYDDVMVLEQMVARGRGATGHAGRRADGARSTSRRRGAA